MEKHVVTEAKGRTAELESINKENALYDRIHLKLLALFDQTHFTVMGRKFKLNKRQKIKRANAQIDKLFDGEIDIRNDAQIQVRLVDREDSE